MAENDAFRVKKRINLKTNSSAGEDPGDIRYDSSGNLRLRDGSSEKTVLDNDNSVTVTNKSIDADNNTITNIGNDELNTGINANKIADGSVSNTEYQYIGGLTSDAQTQLDAKLESGTSATNIGNGDVDNTELSYLNGVTSSVQTQLDGKVDEVSSTDNAIPKFDGTGGSIQDTGVTIDDSNNLQAPADVDVDGTIVLEEQASTPSNPSSGDKKFYAKNDGSLYTLDSAGNEIEVGAGAGGGSIRYINADFETGVSDLVAYADTAQATPVDGTGGSPNVTVTAETSSPLVGDQSALFTKDASNRQGEGCAILSETIDEAYQDSVHTVEFLWSPDANVVEDELKLFVIHPTTGTVEALNFRNELGEYTNSLPTRQVTHRIVAEITPIDDTYRVAVHVAGTSTTAYTGRIDNIQAGPQRLLNAPIVSEWIDFTPNFTVGGNNINVAVARYKRIGTDMVLELNAEYLSSSSDTSLRFDIPDGLNAINERIRFTVGDADFFDSSAGDHFDLATDLRTTGIQILPFASNGAPSTPDSGDKISAILQFTISSWDSGGLVGSSQIDQKTIKFRASGQVTNSFSSASFAYNQLDYPNVDYDDFNVYNSSTGVFTAPKSGVVLVNAGYQVQLSSNLANGAEMILGVWKNGSTDFNVLATQIGANVDSTYVLHGSGVFEVESGDTLEIYQRKSGTQSITAASDERSNYFSVTYMPDLSVFGVFPEKNLMQTKTLSADVTSNGTISDLTFNNLTVGKFYTITGQIQISTNNTDTLGNVTIENGSDLVTQITSSIGVSSGSSNVNHGLNEVFKATDTTLTFTGSSLSANAVVLGNNDRRDTYVTLIEHNDLRETDKF